MRWAQGFAAYLPPIFLNPSTHGDTDRHEVPGQGTCTIRDDTQKTACGCLAVKRSWVRAPSPPPQVSDLEAAPKRVVSRSQPYKNPTKSRRPAGILKGRQPKMVGCQIARSEHRFGLTVPLQMQRRVTEVDVMARRSTQSGSPSPRVRLRVKRVSSLFANCSIRGRDKRSSANRESAA
jgi:hypothetical protein